MGADSGVAIIGKFTLNKLKNKIINYSPLFSSVSNCEQIALPAEMSCNLICLC